MATIDAPVLARTFDAASVRPATAQLLNRGDIACESRCERSERDAGDEVTNNRRQAQRARHQTAEPRIPERQGDVYEQRDLVHRVRSAYLTTRLGRRCMVGEINRELTVLKRLVTLAVQAGKLHHKPHIPMLRGIAP